MYNYDVINAREKIISYVLRLLSSERDDAYAHYSDEIDYCHDMILEAAKELVKAAERDAKDRESM